MSTLAVWRVLLTFRKCGVFIMKNDWLTVHEDKDMHSSVPIKLGLRKQGRMSAIRIDRPFQLDRTLFQDH
jgi:hypothetical protein